MHVQHCLHSSVCSVKLTQLHMPDEENGGFYCIPLVSGNTNVSIYTVIVVTHAHIDSSIT